MASSLPDARTVRYPQLNDELAITLAAASGTTLRGPLGELNRGNCGRFTSIRRNTRTVPAKCTMWMHRPTWTDSGRSHRQSGSSQVERTRTRGTTSGLTTPEVEREAVQEIGVEETDADAGTADSGRRAPGRQLLPVVQDCRPRGARNAEGRCGGRSVRVWPEERQQTGSGEGARHLARSGVCTPKVRLYRRPSKRRSSRRTCPRA